MDRNRWFLKQALQVLEQSEAPGVCARALIEQVECMTDRTFSTIEGARIIGLLMDKNWAISYRDRFTDELRYVITDIGRVALESY